MKHAVLAQSVERKALNLVVGGSSPPVGAFFFALFCCSLGMVWRNSAVFETATF